MMYAQVLVSALLFGSLWSSGAFLVYGRKQSGVKLQSWSTDDEFSKGQAVASISPRQSPTPQYIRSIIKTEKNPRLPVWPVLNGVFLFFLGLISPKLSATLEDTITGRVCPMPIDKSPFVLLVHHVHSFAAWDPVRFIQRKLILPEGFPSHPHRGFVTLTFILDGAFVHRDSLGDRQVYGRSDKESNNQPHSQWLNTGAGVLHEEMFVNEGWSTRQELFQLWINCPRLKKYNAPFSMLLGNDENTTPTVVQEKSKTLVLAGCYQNQCSAAPIDSELAVYYVSMEPNAMWTCDSDTMMTAMVYVRQGSLVCDDTSIEPHSMSYFDGQPGKIRLQTTNEPATFLFLAGQPLGEPVVQQGSFVLNSHDEINRVYADYQAGNFGQPWDHKLSDDEWKQHVQKYPCVYKPADTE
jgi:redox-sensitive bicupin YhaK (pirin superfamily)